MSNAVIPAKAGIQCMLVDQGTKAVWIPAFAGMTMVGSKRLPLGGVLKKMGRSELMKFLRNTFCLLLIWPLCAFLVHAEKADHDKPINIEADALRYDGALQQSVFTGAVVLTKGTIVMRGDKMEVRQDPLGHQYGAITASPGKKAFFRQKREGVDEYVEGEAQSIEYDGRADTVKLTVGAQLRRYRGAVVGDEFSAAVIVYNNTTDVFTLDGSPGSTRSKSGRVRAMLTPKSVTPPAPAVDLQISPQLGYGQ
jgi:lipopolysaccharide export system protein LptA